MKQCIFFAAFAIFFFSCRENALVSDASIETSTDVGEVKTGPETVYKDTTAIQAQYSSTSTPIYIKFKEFELAIDSLEVWDEDGKLNSTQSDTAVVYLELGESIEGRRVRFKKLSQGSFRIYQRFENSVTIMNEGPHCDLTEWKHYDSEWKQLAVQNGQFSTNTYTEEDWEKFIEIDMNELHDAVRKYCGDFWANHIKEAKSPTEYPSGVSTSRIFLKIEFEDNKETKVLERIVSFEIPMGC